MENSPKCNKTEFMKDVLSEYKSKSIKDLSNLFATVQQSADEKPSEPIENIVNTCQTSKQISNSPVCKENESVEDVKSAEKPSEPIENIVNSCQTSKQLSNSPVYKKNESVKSAEKPSEPIEDIDVYSNSVTLMSPQVFRSSSEVFSDDADWEMFYNDQSVASVSHLYRESLYLKFDPLVNLNQTQKEHTLRMKDISRRLTIHIKKSPPKSPDFITMDSPTNKHQSVCRQSVPVKERTVDIDVLFSLTSTKNDNECPEFIGTFLPHKRTIQVLRYTEKDWLKMKQHMEFECQNRVLSIGKEMSEKIKQLTKDYEEKLEAKEAGYNAKFKELENQEQQHSVMQKKSDELVAEMRHIVDEYTVVIKHLIAEKKKYQEDDSKMKAVKEETTLALQDLCAIENTFSALHSRFEKSRTILEGFKKNEDTLKNHAKKLQDQLKTKEAANVTLEKERKEQKNIFQSELAALKKKDESGHSHLQALVKQKDCENIRLKSELEQKTNENEELIKICDELLEMVSNS